MAELKDFPAEPLLTKLEEGLFEIRRVIAGQEEMQVLNVVTAPQTDVSRTSAAA